MSTKFNYKELSNLLVRMMVLQDKRNDYTVHPAGRMLLSTIDDSDECNNFQKFLSIDDVRIIISYYKDDSFYIVTNRDEYGHIDILVNAHPFLDKKPDQIKEIYDVLHDVFKAIFNFVYGPLFDIRSGCNSKDKIIDITNVNTGDIIKEMCIYNIYRMQSLIGNADLAFGYVAETFKIKDSYMESIINEYTRE